MSEVAVISTFDTEEECAQGILALHDARIHDFRAFFPFPSESIMDAVSHVRAWGRSPVRYWQLFGGIIGFLSAIALTFGTSWEWNLLAGGRPIISVPPYIVIMFELTILIGGLAGLTGFFVHNRMPVFDALPGYRSRFSEDKFGLVVQCDEHAAGNVEEVLRNAGAEDITREILEASAEHH
jgi:molybdopterin-containing oxidoreductase family membrane subunit